MALHRQTLFSLAIAAIAEAIPIWTSAEQVPSLHRVAPRYLKLVTSSNFYVYVNVCTDVVHAAGHDLPLAVAPSSSLLVRSSSSP